MLDNLTARYPLTRLAWISIAAPWRRSRSKRWHGRPALRNDLRLAPVRMEHAGGRP